MSIIMFFFYLIDSLRASTCSFTHNLNGSPTTVWMTLQSHCLGTLWISLWSGR